MKKSERQGRDQVSRLLRSNPLPEVDSRKRDALISRLVMNACDMDYMGDFSLVQKMIAQMSYLSPWDFLLQTGILAAIFYFALRGRQQAVFLLAVSLAPMMTGILLYELSKTFGHNMWEMESACRYNLPQIFFLRLCILSGGDFIVLAASLAAFRMSGGMLWQFSLCVLLPFFLNSALCLYFLQWCGKRSGRTVMFCLCIAGEGICAYIFLAYERFVGKNLGTGMTDEFVGGYLQNGVPDSFWGGHPESGILNGLFFPYPETRMMNWLLQMYSGVGMPDGVSGEYPGNGMLDGIFLGAAAVAMVFFLLSAYKLCTKKYYVTVISG